MRNRALVVTVLCLLALSAPSHASFLRKCAISVSLLASGFVGGMVLQRSVTSERNDLSLPELELSWGVEGTDTVFFPMTDGLTIRDGEVWHRAKKLPNSQGSVAVGVFRGMPIKKSTEGRLYLTADEGEHWIAISNPGITQFATIRTAIVALSETGAVYEFQAPKDAQYWFDGQSIIADGDTVVKLTESKDMFRRTLEDYTHLSISPRGTGNWIMVEKADGTAYLVILGSQRLLLPPGNAHQWLDELNPPEATKERGEIDLTPPRSRTNF